MKHTRPRAAQKRAGHVAPTGTATSGVGTWATVALAVGLALVTLRHAWVSDDIYITLRTIDNWVNGFGPTWNVAERVQAYTHPLWFLLLTPLYALIRDPWLTVLLASLVAAAVAAWVVARLSGPPGLGWLALGLLSLSVAYVDYSTSGLENPLSHLLLALFAWRWAQLEQRDSRYLYVALLGGLTVLTRHDLALFVTPALLLALVGGKARHPWRDSLLGAMPVVLWTLFSLLYYGAPLPNTAYAKLGAGLPRGEVLAQGAAYYLDALQRDPLTLALIALALLLPFRRASRAAWPLAVGLLLYLGYVLWIGGCFMSLRFFSSAALWAVCLLALYGGDVLAEQRNWAIVGVLLALGLAAQPITYLAGQEYSYGDATWAEIVGPQRVTDERRVYYPDTGLLNWRRGGRTPNRQWWLIHQQRVFARPEKVLDQAAVGRVGFFVGPERHIIDELGLADPLLARLPAMRNSDWRPGHLYRLIPKGYTASLAQDANLIEDPALAEYYDHLRLVTRGPLWSVARLRTIVALNLGRLNGLINGERYQLPGKPTVTPRDLNSATPRSFSDSGLDIALGAAHHNDGLILALDGDDAYRVEFRLAGRPVGHARVEPTFSDPAGGLVDMRVPAPRAAGKRGYDVVRVLPTWGDGYYAVGTVTLD